MYRCICKGLWVFIHSVWPNRSLCLFCFLHIFPYWKIELSSWRSLMETKMKVNILLYVWKCAQSLGHVWLFMTLWTVTLKAPMSMDYPDKNTEVGCHALLQEIFPNKWSNPHLPCLLNCINLYESVYFYIGWK